MRWVLVLAMMIGCENNAPPACPARPVTGDECSSEDQICLACQCIFGPGTALQWTCEGPVRNDLSTLDLSAED
jgi:hypothetical protein